jgi:formamidopyrimidine-DNA glycosylase
MGGWVRDVTGLRPGEVRDETRLKEHGTAPLDDPSGRPRFLKLMITTEDGGKVAMTDGRRLARLWLSDSPEDDPKVAALGPDVWIEPWCAVKLAERLRGRSAPIKSVMLDQRLFAGVGNWLADEALYQSGIRPDRAAESLTANELDRIVRSLGDILRVAIEAEADERRYPPHWLFNYRWGGNRGRSEIDGEPIVRVQVGGRTTAWVPSRQR